MADTSRLDAAAAIDAHFSRLGVVAQKTRLHDLAILTGVTVTAVHDLDDRAAARAEAELAACARPSDLPARLGELEREAQRKAWRAAQAGLHRDQRNQRGKRPPPAATGYTVPPPGPL